MLAEIEQGEWSMSYILKLFNATKGSARLDNRYKKAIVCCEIPRMLKIDGNTYKNN